MTDRRSNAPAGAATVSSRRAAPAGAQAREVPSVKSLMVLRESLDRKHSEAFDRVQALVKQQSEVSGGLAEELSLLRRDGAQLEALEAADAQQSGLLANITRVLSGRGRLLERRSVAARLHDQYTVVHATLRKAGAFVDELRLCAAELAAEVDELHGKVEESLAASIGAEERAAELEEALSAEHPADADLAKLLRDQDRMRFELADARTEAELHEARARLCQSQLEPARTLRTSVHALHAEMARYVLHASASVENSGRRVQALGLAADAPIVVSELRQGLAQLDTAMAATEAYLDQAHELLTHVLPELSEQLRAQSLASAETLQLGLAEVASHHASDDAELRAAALAEVELLGLKDP